MTSRLVQLTVPETLRDRISELFDTFGARDWWVTDIHDDCEGGERLLICAIARPDEARALLDDLHDTLEDEGGWRVAILPIDAVAPDDSSDSADAEADDADAVRANEEILATVRENGALTQHFLVMSVISAAIATIGLNLDNLAVVIGAMVISPLLGPLMYFAFAVAIGARKMIGSSAASVGAGFGISALAAGGVAMVLPYNSESDLLDYSTNIHWSGLVLPILAGTAAALAVASGRSSAFVGVTVAAALVPALGATGLLLAAGETTFALRSGFTVAMNVIGIALAAQMVFVFAGIRPRTFQDTQTADTSRTINFVTLAILCTAMAFALWYFETL